MAAGSFRRRLATASQSLQHRTSEAELLADAKRRSRRVPKGLSAKTYQQAPLDQQTWDQETESKPAAAKSGS